MHFIANIATILAPTLTGYLVVSYGYPSMFIVAAILAAIAMGAMLFVKPGQQTKTESLFNWRGKKRLEEPRANFE